MKMYEISPKAYVLISYSISRKQTCKKVENFEKKKREKAGFKRH